MSEVEGWQEYLTPGNRKAHYFRKGTSLCKRVGFFRSSVVPGGINAKTGDGDCAACKREVAKEIATEGITPTETGTEASA